jgi:hypothetical protein
MASKLVISQTPLHRSRPPFLWPGWAGQMRPLMVQSRHVRGALEDGVASAVSPQITSLLIPTLLRFNVGKHDAPILRLNALSSTSSTPTTPSSIPVVNKKLAVLLLTVSLRSYAGARLRVIGFGDCCMICMFMSLCSSSRWYECEGDESRMLMINEPPCCRLAHSRAHIISTRRVFGSQDDAKQPVIGIQCSDVQSIHTASPEPSQASPIIYSQRIDCARHDIPASMALSSIEKCSFLNFPLWLLDHSTNCALEERSEPERAPLRRAVALRHLLHLRRPRPSRSVRVAPFAPVHPLKTHESYSQACRNASMPGLPREDTPAAHPCTRRTGGAEGRGDHRSCRLDGGLRRPM